MGWLLERWEKQPALMWTLSVLWVLALCWFTFVWNVGSIGLVDETEPLFAEAARQMTVTGDWVTPYFNEATRFDKPPLVYWLMAIAYQTIGVNEWAARFPSFLSAMVLTLFGFVTLRRFGFATPADATEGSSSRKVGEGLVWSALIGSAVMALHPQTMVWARIGVSDMLLSGCMGSALLAFFWGYTQPAKSRAKTVWYLAFWVLLALAVLAKGPVGIVLPGLIVGAFLLYVGRLWSGLWELMPIRGMLLFLAIAVPWYVLVIQANGQAYIDSFFGYHNFERFTSVVNRHSAPWYFYFLIVLGGFAPHSIHLPVAIARLRFWKVREWQEQPREAQLGIFALIWFGVIFGFFTVAVTKLPSYVLPLLPAASILVGLLWSQQVTRRPAVGWGMKLSHVLNIVLMVAFAIAMFYLPDILGNDRATPNFPEAVRLSGAPIRGALAWAMGAIAGVILLLRRQGRWLWSVNVAAFVVFFAVALMPTLFVMDAQRQLPLRDLSALMVQEQRPNEPFMMAGFAKPSIVFYTQQPVIFRGTAESALRQLLEMQAQPNPPESVLVLGIEYRIEEMNLNPASVTLLGEAERFDLVRVTLPLR
ncbi:ArnT family glycosyltransferase [Leptolyngbya sp. AN02str]|uniref:ArnT family glycosyltransferase n=1 Tax=Leptolyngbya sp. AN02str TaxID=3423363 RepID=UPI003D31099F